MPRTPSPPWPHSHPLPSGTRHTDAGAAHEEGQGQLRLFVLEKGRLIAHLNIWKHVKRECKDVARLFSVVLSYSSRGSAHRMKHRILLLNIRKHTFNVMLTEDRRRLPRGFVESPCFEIFKKLSRHGLGQRALGGPP